MLKTMFLAGTMIVAAPVLAQTATPAPQTAPGAQTATPAPATTEVAPATTPAQPTQAAPAAAATTAPTQAQVAQVVDQQFGTYDKNGDGTLDKAEFAAWMDALKAQANAKTGTAAEQTAWNDAAFKQADGDKSATVTKTELTGFLVKGSSGKS